MTALTWRDRALAAASRYGLRPMLALPIPWRVHRAGFALLHPRPPRGDGIPERTDVISGVPVRIVGPDDAPRTLIWLHGGGFVLGSAAGYAGLARALARRTEWRIVLPDYRLAPEYPFPAGLDDCLAVARAFAAGGSYALGGDSAGGTLALSVCALLLAEGRGPEKMVLASPAVDLNPARPVPDSRDEMMLPVAMLRRVAADYLNGADPADPRVSPVHADFTGAPPVLIQVAHGELLEGDADAIGDCLRRGGAEVEIQKSRGVPHVWQLFVGHTPKADRAVDRMAVFLQAAR